MDFTLSQILFSQTFHSYNKLFSSNEGVTKGLKHQLIYQTKGKIKQCFKKSLTHRMIQYAY
jgi:hypothetical protein